MYTVTVAQTTLWLSREPRKDMYIPREVRSKRICVSKDVLLDTYPVFFVEKYVIYFVLTSRIVF